MTDAGRGRGTRTNKKIKLTKKSSRWRDTKCLPFLKRRRQKKKKKKQQQQSAEHKKCSNTGIHGIYPPWRVSILTTDPISANKPLRTIKNTIPDRRPVPSGKHFYTGTLPLYMPASPSPPDRIPPIYTHTHACLL